MLLRAFVITTDIQVCTWVIVLNRLTIQITASSVTKKMCKNSGPHSGVSEASDILECDTVTGLAISCFKDHGTFKCQEPLT
jgi:hypothetical protein